MEYKRLKLFIEFQAPKKLIFSVTPYSDVNKKLFIGSRELDSRMKLIDCIQKWEESIIKPELGIVEKANEIFKKHYKKLRETIRIYSPNSDKVVSNYESDLEIVFKGYKKAVFNNIKEFSTDLQMDFLPENKDFKKSFSLIIDEPSLAAQKTNLGEAPLVELIIQKELQGIPFWLTRTFDGKTFWMCRYALSVVPFIQAGNTNPPKIDNNIRVISITRPTSDLIPFFPFENHLFSRVDYNSTTWNMVDGVYGKHINPQDFSSLNSNQPFNGVTRNDFRNNIKEENGISPNMIFYQGHWQKIEIDGELTPHLFFSKPDAFFYNDEDLKEPTPLLSGIKPSEHQNSILIMHACGSAAQDDNNSYIERYVKEKSIFIGTNFPILTKEKHQSSSIFENLILRRYDYLAHCVLSTNLFEPQGSLESLNPNENTINEVYNKTAFCQFGDVRANFKRSLIDNEDNVSRIKLKTTDRWKKGLENIGIVETDGFNFIVNEKISEYAPSVEFTLSNDGIEIGIVPLAIAIDLCENNNEYKIVGPAFTSIDTVDLISAKYKSKEAFINSWINIAKRNKKIKIGVLNLKLTSFFMVKNVLLDALSGCLEIPYTERIKMIYENVEYKKALYNKKLRDIEWIKEQDLVLDLDSTKSNWDNSISKIFTNIETSIIQKLTSISPKSKNDIIPRGIFIIKSELYNKPDHFKAIEEFFKLYNMKVENIQYYDNTAIPLLTYDKTNSKHWLAIKIFADKCQNENQSEFEIYNFLKCNCFCSKNELKKSSYKIISSSGKFEHATKQKEIIEGKEKIATKMDKYLDTMNDEYIYLGYIKDFIEELKVDEIHSVITEIEFNEFKETLIKGYEALYKVVFNILCK